MLTQTRLLHTRLHQATDGVLYAGALLFAYWLRATFPWWDLPELEPFDYYLWLLPIVAVLGPVILTAEGVYRPAAFTPARRHQGLRILRASLALVLALILLLFLARLHFARSVVILVGALGGSLVLLHHHLLAWHNRQAASRQRRRLVWIGRPDEIAAFAAHLQPPESANLVAVGLIDPSRHSPDDLSRLLHEHSVNLAVVCLAGIDPALLAPLLWRCTREGVETILRPGLLQAPPYRLVADELGGEPVFYFRAQSASAGQLLGKRILDWCLSGLLLLALAPLFAALAVLVRWSSPGPILFRQSRAGQNGQPFILYKFRTMVPDAENRQAALAHRNEMTGPVFKVTDDPRVTPLGRWLRRHGLDELPQLWNVWRGEMSLVGPRPLPVDEVRRFPEDAQRRRLSVKPGLTCLWQISGRNDIADFDTWVALDLAYIDRWSLLEDLRILWATIPVVLSGRGGR